MKQPHGDCLICPARSLSVFQTLEADLIKRINQTRTSNLYRKGQIIFYENNPAFGMFCIETGKVKLYKTTSEGKRLIVRISGPGDQLGYLAMFGNQPYSATAEVIEDALICFIDRSTLFPLISESNTLTLNYVKTLARELFLVQARATDIAHGSAREKMADVLLLLTKRYGKKTRDGILLNLPLSRTDLAEIAGVTKETAIRILSDFRRKKLIKDQGENIILLSPSQLVKIAGIVE